MIPKVRRTSLRFSFHIFERVKSDTLTEVIIDLKIKNFVKKF